MAFSFSGFSVSLMPSGTTWKAEPIWTSEALIGVPYRWGGRSGDGVDCSGLVQMALAAARIAAPRDSDQQRTLGRPVERGCGLARGDLVFFPGHVGMMVDGERLIHANAYWMAVSVEPQPSLMLRPFGLTPIAVTSAPSSHKADGAT